jgi:hypothetical protein
MRSCGSEAQVGRSLVSATNIFRDAVFELRLETTGLLGGTRRQRQKAR